MSEVLFEVVLTFGKFLKTQSLRRGLCDQNVNVCLLLHLRRCCAAGEGMPWVDTTKAASVKEDAILGKATNQMLPTLIVMPWQSQASNQLTSNFTH